MAVDSSRTIDPSAPVTRSRLDVGWVGPLILVTLVAITYGHTLDVPFYLDDFSSIVENPVIYQWDGSPGQIWRYSAMRIIAYLSLALNYQMHAFQVTGYHVVNILIHILAGMAVLGLLKGLVRTPVTSRMFSASEKTWIPLAAAILFVLHPLQTQAVTYIVQRMASLAALFYVLSMAAYVQARLSDHQRNRVIWIIVCILSAGCGILTKQNTATLPFSMIALEYGFFQTPLKKLGLVALAGGIAILAAGLILVGVFDYNPFSLQKMLAMTRETTTISRESYLATQLWVLLRYIRLFFWPNDLHIDYDFALIDGMYNGQALIGLVIHAGIIGLGIWQLKKHPLPAFGLLFFYLAHAVESSIIPIRDVVFEHRTYLPNLGLIMVCTWFILSQLKRWIPFNAAVAIFLVMACGLGTATWLRNQQWRDPIALWEDNVKKAPGNLRGWDILGKHYLQAGQPEKALAVLNHAMDQSNIGNDLSNGSASVETILNIVVAHKHLKRYDRGLAIIDQALHQDMSPMNRSKFYINRGNILFEQQHFDQAEAAFREAIKIYPAGLTARINLSVILGFTNRIAEGEALCHEVLAIDPGNDAAKRNLALLRDLKTKQNRQESAGR
ncbi:MAG: tetratricopeptide repeat protein [Desulfatirhabdiaceae bacterium]